MAPLAVSGVFALATLWIVVSSHTKLGLLFLVGLGLGVTLYHASFGFTGAYRRALLGKDLSGVAAQLVMLGVASVLFAPVLAAGEVFGHGVSGAVAPVSVSMVTGAFLFGIGMQLGGGCASGTLFTTGSGNVRMAVVLVFFCAGCFLATFHLQWWRSLPSFGAVSFGRQIGYGWAVVLQLSALILIYLLLRRMAGKSLTSLGRIATPQWRSILQGPWPLLAGAIALALLNWVTLLIAGHPWSVTWGFTVWAAKSAMLLGWDPASSTFWSSGFAATSLNRSILEDTTSVMNIGIVLGAMAAAAIAGAVRPNIRIPVPQLLAAVLGGVMLGYGARLAYGCNIGALFSGIASTSLHGWVWIVAAILGNVIGVRLRPAFGLSNQ
jgi:uncharacterized membrane protein YedE/YeeE